MFIKLINNYNTTTYTKCVLKYVAARPHATSFVLITSTFTFVMNMSSHIIILILCLFVHVFMYKRDTRESLGTNMFSLSYRGGGGLL